MLDHAKNDKNLLFHRLRFRVVHVLGDDARFVGVQCHFAMPFGGCEDHSGRATPFAGSERPATMGARIVSARNGALWAIAVSHLHSLPMRGG
jgi:hypothetical protein